LLDCAPAVRHARLVGPRDQPGLSNPQMDCWAAYLRGQADALDLPVIDTTDIGIDDVADGLLVHSRRCSWLASGRTCAWSRHVEARGSCSTFNVCSIDFVRPLSAVLTFRFGSMD
jgi:hypothetical protein